MRVRRGVLLTGSALAVMLCAGTASAQQGRVTRLTAMLSGAAEASSPGSRNARGNASISLDASHDQVCYTIEVSGLQNVTGAHIHKGDVGKSGPVVIPLAAPKNGTANGCVQADPKLIDQMSKDPGSFYVNVHDQEYPAGAIRGQLRRVM